ncbi:hypothetical protein ACU4GA_09405 [Methylobacterium oryzae CBMB20]
MTEPISAAAHARTILAAHEHRRQIAPLTDWDPALDLPAAYRVAEAVRALRAERGERPVGYKIGFTNTTLWERYGVRAPIWGPVYDTTLRDRAALSGPVPLAAFVEPRIEPEIVFGLARAPESGMDAEALIACLDWAASGFEIVQSLYPAGASPRPTPSRLSGCTGCWWWASGCRLRRARDPPGSTASRASPSTCCGTGLSPTGAGAAASSGRGRSEPSATSSMRWLTIRRPCRSRPAQSSPPAR